jgi:hypothetical protein
MMKSLPHNLIEIRRDWAVVDTLVLRSLNPLEHGVFQEVFGEILTVLIALADARAR